jgi:hypothetical protein
VRTKHCAPDGITPQDSGSPQKGPIVSANGQQEDIAAPPGLDRSPEQMVWNARVEGQTNEEIAATLGISAREVSQMPIAHHESCQKEPRRRAFRSTGPWLSLGVKNF